MTSSFTGVPRVYDDVDDVGTLVATNGSHQAGISYKGGTALMPAAVPPALKGPAAWVVAANVPGQVRIRVAPQAKRRSSAPTALEWTVAVVAGLAAAILIGAVAAVI